MEEILFSNDPYWSDSGRTLYDPRQTAWIETDTEGQRELAGYLPGTPLLSGETSQGEHRPNRIPSE